MTSINTTKYPLANPRHRVAAAAVDAGFYIVTLGIGWFIWSLVTWAQGQTPGKQVLKIRVVSARNGAPANWGRMFLRQVLVGSSLSFGWACILDTYLYLTIQFDGATYSSSTFTICLIVTGVLSLIFLVLDIVWFFQKSHRRLLDHIVGTYVVNESLTKDFQSVPNYDSNDDINQQATA